MGVGKWNEIEKELRMVVSFDIESAEKKKKSYQHKEDITLSVL